MSVVETSTLLCRARTLRDGRFGCGVSIPRDAFGALTTITIRVEASGRGPTIVEDIVVAVPLGNPAAATFALALRPERVLALAGEVRDMTAAPAPDAWVELGGLTRAGIATDAAGRYLRYIALPDGIDSGVLTLDASSVDQTQSAHVELTLLDLPLGLTEVDGDVTLGPTPGAPPLVSHTRRVLLGGTLVNRDLRERAGLTRPLPDWPLTATGTNWSATSTTSTAAGVWSMALVCNVEPCAPTLTLTLPGADPMSIALGADLPAPGQTRSVQRDLEARATTVLIQGLARTPAGDGLGPTEVRFTLGTRSVTTLSAADGAFDVALTAPPDAGLVGVGTLRLRYPADPSTAGLVIERATPTVDIVAGGFHALSVDGVFEGATLVFTGRITNGHLAANDEQRGVPGARVEIASDLGPLCTAFSEGGADLAEVGFYRCEVPSTVFGDATSAALTTTVSGRGSATVPSTLDLTSITPGTIVPIANSVTVLPTTVRAAGIVRDSLGTTVAGALVGVSLGARAGLRQPTAADGQLSGAVVTLPDATPGLLRIDALRRLGSINRTASVVLASTPTAGSLNEITQDLTLDGPVPDASHMALLAFAGDVQHALLPGVTVPGAVVEIRGAGADLALGVLCLATANALGRYACPEVLITDGSDTSLEVEQHVMFASTPIADPTFIIHTITRGATTTNQLTQNVSARPTTLTISGHVREGLASGAPLEGVVVNTSGALLGAATTDAQGAYRIVLFAATTLADVTLTVGVTHAGSTVSSPITVSLAPNEVSTRTVDLAFPLYRVFASGTVDNLDAPGSLVPGIDVSLAADGRVFCRATTTDTGFDCLAPLVRETSAGPLVIDWTATRPDDVVTTGTLTVPNANLPAAGGSLTLSLPIAIHAPALRVTGLVKTTAGLALDGVAVDVAIADRTHALVTDNAGRYAVTLSFAAPQSLPAVVATATRGRHVIAATATNVAIPDALTTLTLDIDLPLATQLEVSGIARNANDAGAPLGSGVVRVEVSAPSITRTTLCESTTTPLGAFTCGGVVPDVELTELDLHTTWLRDGDAWTNTVTTHITGLATDGVANTITGDITFAPTTVQLHGTVTDSDGNGLANVGLTFYGADYGASASSGPGGVWTMTFVVPLDLTTLTGTLEAYRGGNDTQLAVNAAITPATRNELERDLVLATRRLGLRGRLVSTHADAGVPDMVVTFTRAGTEVCMTTTLDSSAPASAGRYTCSGIALDDDQPVTLDWSVSGAYPAATGTFTVPTASLPPEGSFAEVVVDLPIAVRTLLVSGVLRREGTPHEAGTVKGDSDTLTRSTTTDVGGSYLLPFVFPDATTTATVDLVGSDGSNSGVAQLVVPLEPGLTQATQDIAIQTTGLGTAAWDVSAGTTSSFRSLQSGNAPAYDPVSGRLYAGVDTALRALDATTGQVAWTAGVSGGGYVRSNVLLADGRVWVLLNQGQLRVYSDLGASASLVARIDDVTSVSASARLLATPDNLLLVIGASQQAALDRTTLTPLWLEEVPLSESPPALHPDGTLIAATFDGLVGRDFDAEGSVQRFFVATPGEPRAPVIRADGSIVAIASGGARIVSPGGVVLAARDWPEAAVSHPTLLPDGRIAVVIDDHLRLLRVAADTFETDLDVALDSDGAFDDIAPLLLADGADTIAYITTGSSSGSYLHALYVTGPSAGTHAFAPYLAQGTVPGSTQLTAPTAPPGLIVMQSRTRIYAVSRPPGTLVASPWPMLGQGFDNTFAAEPDTIARRRIALSGVVTNSNVPGLVLSGAELVVSVAGTPVTRNLSAADGTYTTRFPTALDLAELELSATFLGADAVVSSTVPSAPANTTEPVTLDVEVPVTTLVVSGVVTLDGVPVEGLEVISEGDHVMLAGAPVTDVDGRYTLTLAFAGIAEADLLMSVLDPVAGWMVYPRSVTLTPGGLTTATFDFDVGPPDPPPSHDIRASFPDAEYLYSSEGAALGAGVVTAVHAYSACTDDGCHVEPWLVAVTADGVQSVSRDGLENAAYLSTPTVGADDHVFTPMFDALATQSAIAIHDASLAHVQTLLVAPAESFLSPPAVVETGPTVRVYILSDDDFDDHAELIAWDVDLTNATSTEAFVVPLAVPSCDGRCLRATDQHIVIASGGRLVIVDPADGEISADVLLDDDPTAPSQIVLRATGIYAVTGDTRLFGLDLTGAPLSGFPVTLSADTTSLTANDAGDLLWLTAGDTLVKLGSDGTLIETLPDDCFGGSGLALADDEVWAMCNSDITRYLDFAPLIAAETYPTGAWLAPPPIVVGPNVFALSYDGVVFVLTRP